MTGLDEFESELLCLLPRLRRFARSLTRDPVKADDLCQVAIERALRFRASLRDDARMDAWLFTMVRNCWTDEQRSQGRHQSRTVSLELVPADDLADRAAGTGPLTSMDLRRAVERLPVEQRECVALVWIEGFAYREASEMLGLPIGTLTSRLARARKALLAVLEEPE